MASSPSRAHVRESSAAWNCELKFPYKSSLVRSSTFSLYFDGFILDQRTALSNFEFNVPTIASAEPVVFVGGASPSVLPAIADKQFSGCIDSVAFNFK